MCKAQIKSLSRSTWSFVSLRVYCNIIANCKTMNTSMQNSRAVSPFTHKHVYGLLSCQRCYNRVIYVGNNAFFRLSQSSVHCAVLNRHKGNTSFSSSLFGSNAKHSHLWNMVWIWIHAVWMQTVFLCGFFQQDKALSWQEFCTRGTKQ